jgi:hypothetical protein
MRSETIVNICIAPDIILNQTMIETPVQFINNNEDASHVAWICGESIFMSQLSGQCSFLNTENSH